MESWKLGSPDQTSSDEDDQNDQRLEGVKDVKRSYECTFCKRGFTNAQALGGHMNIHRKDRAKAKQLISGTTNNHYYSNDEFMSMTSSQLSTPISSQPAAAYPVWHAHGNYYFQPSGSAPRLPYGYAMEDDHHSLAPRSQGLSVNHEVWGANLSLRFSPTHLEDDHELRRGVRNGDEVDLELRLGHG